MCVSRAGRRDSDQADERMQGAGEGMGRVSFESDWAAGVSPGRALKTLDSSGAPTGARGLAEVPGLEAHVDGVILHALAAKIALQGLAQRLGRVVVVGWRVGFSRGIYKVEKNVVSGGESAPRSGCTWRRGTGRRPRRGSLVVVVFVQAILVDVSARLVVEIESRRAKERPLLQPGRSMRTKGQAGTASASEHDYTARNVQQGSATQVLIIGTWKVLG